MALTELQKAQNRAAQLVRDRAHSSRCKLLCQAIEAAENSHEVKRSRAALDEAMANADASMNRCNAQIRDLEAQITELQDQVARLRNSPERDALNDLRRAAASEWSKTRETKVAEAQSLFPDLDGSARYSAATWQPPQGVLEAMEEARRNAVPAPRKVKTTA